MAPITLLYGPNSAGKSTIIEAILMLAQTLNGVDMDRVLESRGPWVNLRDYRTLIHNHNVQRTLKLGLFWSVDPSTFQPANPKSTDATEGGVLWSWSLNEESNIVRHDVTDYFLADLEQPVFHLAINCPYDLDPLWSNASPTKPPEKHPEPLIHGDIDFDDMESLFSLYDDPIEPQPRRGISAEQATQEGSHVVPETYWDPRVPMNWVESQLNAPSIRWLKFAKQRVEKALKRWRPFADQLDQWLAQINADPALAKKMLRRAMSQSSDTHPAWYDDDNWTTEAFQYHLDRLKEDIPEWLTYLREKDPLKQSQNWAELFLAFSRGNVWDAYRDSPILWDASQTSIMGLYNAMGVAVPGAPRQWIGDQWMHYIIPGILQWWYENLPRFC